LKAVSEAPLDLLYLRNARPHKQEVINVHRDVHIAPDEDTQICVDGLEAKIA
jgi:hypothetical protein